MKRALWSLAAALLAAVGLFCFDNRQDRVAAQPKPAEGYWNIDDVRAGMRGFGKTVVKGIKVEQFDVEILGVLRNTSPGRDMVLARLSGLDLEKTGVIQGMSGSPVYLHNKLLGAVAYAWAYGKEPIAGITPFSQMKEYVASYERRDVAEKNHPRRIGLADPVRIGGESRASVTVSDAFDAPQPAAADGIWLTPLRTPLMASGISPRALALMRDDFAQLGMVPMAGGAAGNLPESERNATIEPGSALAVSLITGDFDMSGIGTVTQVEGKRVYGWGHPFFAIGGCEFPLMTGYTHMILARRSISFKMGSPLKAVGVINADVSTCIAGWLDRQADMIPVSATVLREGEGPARTFNVKLVRQRGLVPSLTQVALMSCLDTEGDLPDEITAQFKARIELEGRPSINLGDLYSGPNYGGSKGPQSLYTPVSMLLQLLTNNSFENVRIKNIEATTEIMPGRRTAEIEGAELESDVVAPGETLRATVLLRPFKGVRQRVPLNLILPPDLPEGSYTATISDDLSNMRQELRDNPHLGNPQSVEQLFDSIQLQASAKRTNLALRVPVAGVGVTSQGKTLPNLPGSVVQMLSNGRRTGAQTINSALVVRQPTGWVVQGSETVRFQVAKNKHVSTE
jgi:hypothetical protein